MGAVVREDRNKSGVLMQILVAAAIALLVGGTSPWWWKEIRRPQEQTAAKSSALPEQPVGPTQVPAQPTPDFPGGSKPAYSATFLQWPVVTNEHGFVGPLNGEYVLAPTSNTWVGPGDVMPITPLAGDFIFEAHFRIAERHSEAAFHLELLGSGPQADYLSVFLDISDIANATYTLDKGWIKDQHYLTRDKLIAERAPLAPAIATSDWSKPSKISLKREGGVMQFFVNDLLVREFPVTIFTVANVSVEAAFPSKIVVTSLEGRVRP